MNCSFPFWKMRQIKRLQRKPGRRSLLNICRECRFRMRITLPTGTRFTGFICRKQNCPTTPNGIWMKYLRIRSRITKVCAGFRICLHPCSIRIYRENCRKVSQPPKNSWITSFMIKKKATVHILRQPLC